MLGQDHVSSDSLDIDQKLTEKYVISDEDERKQKHLMMKLKKKGYRDLQLATTKLAFQLVSLAKTVNLPNGSLAKAWTALKDEYDPSEGVDKIKLLEDIQDNKLLNAKVNITERLASLSTQVMKLNILSHSISDDYLMTHIFASLPPEYSSAVGCAKIDLRKHTLNLIESKKRIKEKYMQVQKEKGLEEDEMALSTSQNSARFQKKVTNPRQTPRFKGRCCHCGKWGHKKEQCREWLKLTKEQQEQADKEKSEQRSEEEPRKYL